MCLDPITMSVLAVGQGVMQYQQISAQAEAQQAMYNAQAQADEQNAAIQNRKNESVADAYGQEQLKLDARRRLARGQAAAAFGAGGMSMGEGTGLDILTGIQEGWQSDSQNLLTNQRNDIYSGRIQEGNYLNQASANRAASANIGAQAKLAKMSTILGTVANTAMVYNKFGGGSSGGSSGSNQFTSVQSNYAKDQFGNYNPKISISNKRYGGYW